MKQVKVGVIGAGRMGQRHCRVYSTLRQAQLVGICDANPAVGSKIAQQYEVEYFQEIDDLLAQVDAVSLATPTPLHFDLAMRCLAHGVHVLIEKPITETVEEAEALARAAEESGLIVQVGHIERFNPVYAELKNVLEDMTVVAVNLRRLSAYEGSNTDVDVVLDLMIHDIDLVLDLMGQEPSDLSAYGITAFSGMLDHVVVQMEFDNGPMLTMTASRLTEQKIRSIEVTALEAYVESDLLNKTLSVNRRTIGEYVNHNHRSIKYRQESVIERIYVPTVEPLFTQLQHFVECVSAGRQPLVPARDGLRALNMAARIRAAIQDHLTVVSQGMPANAVASFTPELTPAD